MKSLEERDRALIEAAGAAIRRNYDGENFHHTVGAAVRCGSGAAYTGVNVYSIHGACAEQVAIGSAITNGERVLEAIADRKSDVYGKSVDLGGRSIIKKKRVV